MWCDNVNCLFNAVNCLIFNQKQKHLPSIFSILHRGGIRKKMSINSCWGRKNYSIFAKA